MWEELSTFLLIIILSIVISTVNVTSRTVEIRTKELEKETQMLELIIDSIETINKEEYNKLVYQGPNKPNGTGENNPLEAEYQEMLNFKGNFYNEKYEKIQKDLEYLKIYDWYYSDITNTDLSNLAPKTNEFKSVQLFNDDVNSLASKIIKVETDRGSRIYLPPLKVEGKIFVIKFLETYTEVHYFEEVPDNLNHFSVSNTIYNVY